MKLPALFSRKKTFAAAPQTRDAALYGNLVVDRLAEMLLQMPDPDEVLRALGLSRRDLRILETDDEIAAACDTRREAVVAVPWRLEPGKGRAVNWLWQELSPHLETLIRGAWSALPYGYSVLEVVYRQDGGRIGVARIEEKPFGWFAFKPDGTLLWLDPLTGAAGVPVMEQYPDKFILSTHRPSYRNPYGESLFSRLFLAWKFRTEGWKFWAKTLERTGTPFLKGTAPQGTQADGKTNVEALSAVLAAAVQNATLSLPEGWAAEFMSAPQTGASFEAFESACTKRIQKLILGQTLTSDVGSGGSYAAAKVHDLVRQDRRNADIRMVCKAVQQVVESLWRLNRFTGPAPLFVMEDGLGLEADRADRDAKLVQAGVVTLTPDYLLRCYDFEEGDFQTPSPAPHPAVPSGPPANFKAAAAAPFTPAQMAVEHLADAALAAAPQPVSVEALRSAVLSATGPEDLELRLAQVLKEADSGEFRRVLEQALFAADVMGYAHAGG